jgi:hypothetical protein
MLSSVVDECLTFAIASASRHVNQRRQRSLSRPRWDAPLAAYPRLAAALEKAAADGLLAPRSSRRQFH